jgi:type I restriction enzyme, S subunit
MSSEWRSYRLNEVGRIVTGKTPKGGYPELFDGAVPFVTPPDFAGQKWISGTGRSLSEAGAISVRSSVIPARSVLVTCIGSDMGKAAIVSTRCVTNQQINALVVDETKFSPEFLYYNLALRKDEIRGMASGSAQPILNKSAFGEIRLHCPCLAEQDRIVELLRPIDDRIALLRETNATLEAIAQALFKSWFVDFDPVRTNQQGLAPAGMDEATAALFPDNFEEATRSMIPVGWTVQPLGNWLSVLETGRRPKGGVSGIQGGVPSIGAESITRIGQFDFTKTKFVSADFFASMRGGALQSHDVLLYKDGGKPGVFLPQVSMFGDGFPFDVCGINEHVFRMRALRPLGQTFLYFLIWSDSVMHELKHRGGKAAIPGINQSDVREIKFLLPSNDVLTRFDELTAPPVGMILNNAKQAQTLATLRDTLLPRLISGQLRLPDSEPQAVDAHTA